MCRSTCTCVYLVSSCVFYFALHFLVAMNDVMPVVDALNGLNVPPLCFGVAYLEELWHKLIQAEGDLRKYHVGHESNCMHMMVGLTVNSQSE